MCLVKKNWRLSICAFRGLTAAFACACNSSPLPWRVRAQDVSQMVDAFPDLEIKEIHVAMVGVFERMKANLLAEGILPDNLPKRA